MSLRPAGTTGRMPMSSRYIEASIVPTGPAARCGRSRRRALGEPDTAALEADQHHAVETTVALDDLVCHAGHRPAHVVGAEHLLGRPSGRSAAVSVTCSSVRASRDPLHGRGEGSSGVVRRRYCPVMTDTHRSPCTHPTATRRAASS